MSVCLKLYTPNIEMKMHLSKLVKALLMDVPYCNYYQLALLMQNLLPIFLKNPIWSISKINKWYAGNMETTVNTTPHV